MEKSNFDVYLASSLIESDYSENYTCGHPGLDYFITHGYKELERNHVTALSSVYSKGNLIGFYALSTSESTDSFTDVNRQLSFGSASIYQSIPVVKIDHLSVSRPYQHDVSKNSWHFGSMILKYIFRMLLNIGTEFGVAFAGVVVDSVPDAIDFYLKQGFHYVNLQEENAVNQETYQLGISYDDMLKAYD